MHAYAVIIVFSRTYRTTCNIGKFIMSLFKKIQSVSQKKADFKNLFMRIAPHKNRYIVFSDFCFCMAVSFRNALGHKYPEHFSNEIESEYKKVMLQYALNDRCAISELMGSFIWLAELQQQPRDLLGEFFMEMGLGEASSGQFFTPFEISLMMAKINFGNISEKLNDKAFLSVSDPACGAGSTLLAVVSEFISQGVNPNQRLFVHGIDIDRTVALMCYVQLSIWHVPAEIIVGNSLTLETREAWHTPAFQLGGWQLRTNQLKRPSPSVPEQPQDEINFVLVGQSYF